MDSAEYRKASLVEHWLAMKTYRLLQHPSGNLWGNAEQDEMKVLGVCTWERQYPFFPQLS